ncbi:MAG: efflux RND transporter permease subunit [Rubripirellula sp.]
MISRFFIDRPIFATVISIVITLAGGIAVFSLPVAQYPEITPPTVQVACQYPGANANVIADTVAAPIEQQVNGVEDMLYMQSQSANDGSYVLTITFALGTDLDESMVAVQNRVALAVPQLPNVVQALGVDVKKKSTNMLLAINFVSPDGRYDDLYMSNYATINVKDELSRLDGVGDVQFLGERDYSMRVWLDPDELAAREITTNDVITAIQQQNLQVAAGQVGEPPETDVAFQVTTSALGRLTTPEQFGDIIIKTVDAAKNDSAPRIVFLRDVARVELGADSYANTCMMDGLPSVAMGIYQRPGANAINAGESIRAKMEELRGRFPDGLEYEIVFDTTPFISESIHQVFGGLRDAIILVSLVVLLFLQNWRAAVIPLIAVPVAIIGTFAALIAIGFSINTLSLFGLVLAIGIVVDDAIVVVENVQRLLDQGHSPKEAARLAMDEVTGPVVAVALVLAAVFVPCAFISGITGEFFRQFAVTVTVSMAISAVNSLTFSPAMAALLLKPRDAKPDLLTRLINLVFGWAFRLFNRGLASGTDLYIRTIRGMIRVSIVVLVIYFGLLYGTYWTFSNAPQGFIPLQDKSWLLVNVELPDSASSDRTKEVMKQVADIAAKTPGVAHTITVSGQSFLIGATSSNYGSMFIILEPFEKRKSFDLNGLVIFLHLRKLYPQLVRDAEVSVFPPPPVNGLGATGGFNLMIEDRANRGPKILEDQATELVAKGAANKNLAGVMTLYRPDTPEVRVDIDRSKVRAMGVALDDVSQALEVYLGSVFVNNFNEFGRSWRVKVQADEQFRRDTANVGRLQVRNTHGQMVPLAAMVDIRDSTGPAIVTRYNMYPSAPINGRTQLGVSSGEAITIMDEAIKDLGPNALKTEWTSLSYMQIQAGNTAVYVFGLALVFVFLVLAALYESWSLPVSILLAAPLGLLFSVAGVWAVPYMNVGIFTQIGFVVLIGLACKNAILVVEFAEQRLKENATLMDATIDACHLRLRPIIMTSCAFILGVVPLIIEGGAGAEMRRSLGIAVFCGMLGVTVFGIFLTPVFYYMIRRGFGGLSGPPWIRLVGHLLLACLSGAILGILLWRATGLAPVWSATVAASCSLAVATLMLGLRYRRPKSVSASGDSSPVQNSTEK